MQKLLILTVLFLLIPGQAVAKHVKKPKPPCSSGTNARIAGCLIWHVFPRATRILAYRVARCETVGFTDFYNNSSGATDLFQEMPGNDGRAFFYHGRGIKLNFKALSDHRPTWHATIVAYYQSEGGYNWSEWVCKP